jgi:hypothetical protein
MRIRIIVAAAAILVAIVGALGGLVVAGYPGTASAKDPGPPPGMQQACENMDHEGMEQMHEGAQGMHGASEDIDQGDMEQMHEGMRQGIEGMNEGMMNGDGQKGEAMQSGMPEMH